MGLRNRELACHPSFGTLVVSSPTHKARDHKGYPVEDTTIELAAPRATHKFCNARNRAEAEMSKGTTDAQSVKGAGIVDMGVCIRNKGIMRLSTGELDANKPCRRTGMPPMRETIGSPRSSIDVISPLGIPSSTAVSTSVRRLSFSESESNESSLADILGSKGTRELVSIGVQNGREFKKCRA